MQFMFLIYLDETKFVAMSQTERDGFVNAMLDYDDELKESGHYIMSEPLKVPIDAITVRNWNGKLTSTEGPFMVTPEHLSGFFIIKAKDINEAVLLASTMPLATIGSIEVRPLDIAERR
jgi:hypothetical protein